MQDLYDTLEALIERHTLDGTLEALAAVCARRSGQLDGKGEAKRAAVWWRFRGHLDAARRRCVEDGFPR